MRNPLMPSAKWGLTYCVPNLARCNFIEILTVDAAVCPRFARKAAKTGAEDNS
jgi:hypothetical protein